MHTNIIFRRLYYLYCLVIYVLRTLINHNNLQKATEIILMQFFTLCNTKKLRVIESIFLNLMLINNV